MRVSTDNQEVKAQELAINKYCKEHNITVAYDNNYRAKLWSVEEAGKGLPFLEGPRSIGPTFIC